MKRLSIITVLLFSLITCFGTTIKPLIWDNVLFKKTPTIINVTIVDNPGVGFDLSCGTTYYVDYCQYSTISVYVWKRVIMPGGTFPNPNYQWTWVWCSCYIQIPAYSQMGTAYYTESAGQYTNGEYVTHDLTPCN